MAEATQTKGGWAKWIIGAIILIVLIAVILFIAYYYKKTKAEKAINDAKEADKNKKDEVLNKPVVIESEPCFGFSQSDYNKAANAVRLKCLPKTQIPFVGPGLYNKCVNEGIGQIPPVVNC